MAREPAAANDDAELVFTLDQALTSVGFGKFQVLVLAYAGLGAMSEAMEVMILSFIGPAVKAKWELSSELESLITTVVFAGMLIGAYSWGLIADNYGRRTGLLSVAVVTSIFALLSSFSPNYVLLVLFRMIVGIGLGGGPVYSSWFLEFVPVQNRGTWMVLFATFWTIGTILEASLAWIVMPKLGWRWLLVLSSLPCCVAFALYFLTVESPRYLYLNGKISEAHDILENMAAVNRSKLPSGMLVYSEKVDDGEVTSLEHEQLLSTAKTKLTNRKPDFFSLSTLLSPSLRKSTILIWAVYFANAFCYYGVVLLTSQFSGEQSKCGETVLLSNQSNGTSLYSNTFVTSLAEVPGLVISAVLVDKIGRRISMAVMYACGVIFLLPLMFQQKEILTTLLLFGTRMFIIGDYTVAGVYCPEIYPTSVRTTGIGVASAVGRIASMICPLVAVSLVSNCHRIAAISLFGGVMILAGICVLLFPVETKGRELNDAVLL